MKSFQRKVEMTYLNYLFLIILYFLESEYNTTSMYQLPLSADIVVVFVFA